MIQGIGLRFGLTQALRVFLKSVRFKMSRYDSDKEKLQEEYELALKEFTIEKEEREDIYRECREIDKTLIDCYTQSKLKMNLDIRLKDGTQVIVWDANDLYQWWITGFNPDKRFQDVKAEDLVMTGMVDFDEERVMWKEFVHTAEFDDQNVEKINDNWCLDFVHRNAVMKWEGGNRN